MMEAQKGKKTLTIFREEKNPMQSGESHSEFIGFINDGNEDEDWEDVNMGWTSSSNTLKQIHLKFDNLDDAEAFAKKYYYDFIIKKKSYFDNFRKKNS